jgi:hypothetical protein
VLKKIRRMLALQGFTLSAAMWFAWKNREAIERSVRAARAAWNQPSGTRRDGMDDVVVAVMTSDPDTVGRSGMAGTSGSAVAAPSPTAVRLGY